MDNTEAVENLAGIIVDSLYRQDDDSRGYGPAVDSSDRAAQEVLAAIRADLIGYFPPKPLVWRDIGGNDFVAETSIGNYCVSKPKYYGDYECRFPYGGGATRPTLEAIQASAYDDLCSRGGELF